MVERVKSLEVALKRKTKRVLLSDSEEEETEAQGRKTHDLDPLVSLVQELVTPSKTPSKTVNASEEEQVEDISPTTLEHCNLNKISTSIEEINAGSLDVNTSSDPVTTDSIRVSVPSPDREKGFKEDKDDKPTKRLKRRKQIARKGLHTDLDKDDSEDLDEASEKDDSTSSTNASFGRKIYNFVGRVKGLKVFVGNFTYECDFMVLVDTTSVIDHDLGLERLMVMVANLVVVVGKACVQFGGGGGTLGGGDIVEVKQPLVDGDVEEVDDLSLESIELKKWAWWMEFLREHLGYLMIRLDNLEKEFWCPHE
ncbi:hypothetical protein Tco_0123235 [Tanacetum coccineum]